MGKGNGQEGNGGREYDWAPGRQDKQGISDSRPTICRVREPREGPYKGDRHGRFSASILFPSLLPSLDRPW